MPKRRTLRRASVGKRGSKRGGVWSSGSARKLKLITRKVVYVFFGLAFSVTFIGVFFAFNYFREPFAAAGLGSISSREFRGDEDFNIFAAVLDNRGMRDSKISDARLVMLRPSQGTVYIVKLNVEDEVFVRGVGNEKLEDLYAISNINSEGDMMLMVRVLESYASHPVNGFVFTDDNGLSKLKSEFGQDIHDIGGLFTWVGLLRNIGMMREVLITDLSLGEIINIVKLWSSLRESDINFRELDSEQGLEGKGLRLETLVTEKQLVLVLNATTTSGLASDYARIIRRQGGEVLKVGNAEVNRDYSVIFYKEYSESVRVLAENLRISDVRQLTPKDLEGEPVTERADITVILGRDKVVR